MKLARFLLMMLPTAVSCQDAPDAPIAEKAAIGSLTYAIGLDVRELGFEEVRCREDDLGVTTVELLSNQIIGGPQGEPQQPRVLIARVRERDVLEAHAFAANAVHEGIEYPMLHIVAKDVPGAPSARAACQYDGKELVCNETAVVGWQGRGPLPKPSFKVRFSCPQD